MTIKTNKILIQELDKEGNVISEKGYKNLKVAERELNIDYFRLYNIYLLCTKRRVREPQEIIKKLMEKIRIIDNPINGTEYKTSI